MGFISDATAAANSAFLVTKPQFDTKRLEPGTPLQVDHVGGYPKGWQNIHRAALVVAVSPLEVSLAIVEKTATTGCINEEGTTHYTTEVKALAIDLVAENQIKLTPLIKFEQPKGEPKNELTGSI